VVGSSVGADAPTPLHVPSVPAYAFDPSLDLAEEASSTLHSHSRPTESARRTRPAESPAPPTSSKRAAVEARGKSYDNPIVESSTNVTQDRLGRLVAELSAKLTSAPSWKQFVTEHRGQSYLSQDLDSIDHSARAYLQRLREQGVRVPLDDPPWSTDAIDACALHGPHPSANLFKEFLRDEMADFIEAGFWVVLPLDQVRALDQDLRLSPLAVKDEGEKRRPRVLVDHTWFGVNEHTVTELPPEVMQFGGALPRILWLLRHADPDLGPVYLAKLLRYRRRILSPFLGPG
jgi:hypothetical protein